MKFYKEKCKVLRLERNNPRHQYMLGDTQLYSSAAENDLGVLVGTKLNVNQQCAPAAKKVSSVPDCIRQSITSRLKEVTLLLYSVVVRPHLKYCIQFWAPQYKRELYILERVRYRTTKMGRE